MPLVRNLPVVDAISSRVIVFEVVALRRSCAPDHSNMVDESFTNKSSSKSSVPLHTVAYRIGEEVESPVKSVSNVEVA